MIDAFKSKFSKVWYQVTHFLGRVSGRFYFEDFVRVYPNGRRFNRFGIAREATEIDIRNYLNHRKFYAFASQFAAGRSVLDVGCGSGYSSELFDAAGARRITGIDVSRAAIRFAKRHYGRLADFAVQNVLTLDAGRYDLVVCSEVLEHVKEYGKERQALSAIIKATAPNGILIVATPNTELLSGHGFSFAEISRLFEGVDCLIFENAFEGEGYETRRAAGMHGTVITQDINFSEAVLPPDPKTKIGDNPGRIDWKGLQIDTTLLHNTHSWIVVALPHRHVQQAASDRESHHYRSITQPPAS